MSLFAHIFITRNFKKIRDQIKRIVLWQTCPKFCESHPPPKKLGYAPAFAPTEVSAYFNKNRKFLRFKISTAKPT